MFSRECSVRTRATLPAPVTRERDREREKAIGKEREGVREGEKGWEGE